MTSSSLSKSTTTLRQLMSLEGPKVSLARSDIVESASPNQGSTQKVSYSSNNNPTTTWTAACRICTYRQNGNQTLSLSSDHHRHRLILEPLLGVWKDECPMILCPLCLSVVKRLLALTEEVEDIKARIRAVILIKLKVKMEQEEEGRIKAEQELPGLDNFDDDEDEERLAALTFANEDVLHVDDDKEQDGDGIWTFEFDLDEESPENENEVSDRKSKSVYLTEPNGLGPPYKKSKSKSRRRVGRSKKSQTCPICGQSFPTKTKLLQHEQLLHPKKPLPSNRSPQCHFCGKVFSSISTCRYHMRTVHEAKKIVPDVAPRPHGRHGAPSAANKEYTCHECGKVYHRWCIFVVHMKESHLLDPTTKEVCPICHKRFMKGEIFKAHTHPDPEDPSVVAYICPLCGTSLKSTGCLRAHLTFQHGPQEDCQCPKCGKIFKSKKRLRDHSYTCSLSEEDRRKCQVEGCAKEFSTSAERVEHERVVHRGLISYRCYFCSKAFPRITPLEDHMTLHTGERPYVCEKCGAEFRCSSSWRSHQANAIQCIGVKDKEVLETIKRE